ncbi:MAG: hypothetical protein PHQ19_10200, partial [Candidatus Krumholzibacteria bacterium]|nr:hypothetical protein [Candidatus Krumholzibacteria bacterium]
MIELRNDSLTFTFPEVHPEARMTIEFQRTLRIPDDETVHFLPPGLGPFPVRHVDDFAGTVPAQWLEHGGVMLPMHQSEAMWLHFRSQHLIEHGRAYPFAVKIAAGKIDAVTGKQWTNALHGSPQDYLVIPEQPWLDGFCVEKGVIRQFVAMPLGGGYTAEEQITGTAEHGGLQIIVYPMKRSVFERRFPKLPPRPVARMNSEASAPSMPCLMRLEAMPDMGLAPGGRMRQEICEDPYGHGDWYRKTSSRCFLHIANSLVWRAVTGEAPPTIPPTARQYSDAG